MDPTSFSEAQIAKFESTLSHDDVQLFRKGVRLSLAARRLLLSTLSSDQQESRGLRFPDEPSHSPPLSEELRAAEAAADNKSAAFRPDPNLQSMLMVLWHVADPLWLDLAVRSYADGINIGFNGDSGPNGASKSLPANMIDMNDPDQLDALLAAMRKDISRGNSTDFSKAPLFDWFRAIPAGVVPKKDEAVYRFIKDYSQKGSASSINAMSAKIPSSWCEWASVVSRLHAARGGLASSWDIANAYPTLPVRRSDRHLTVSFIEGFGFSSRLRGDMGLARAGFMWELLGGKLLSTFYYVMSFFTTVASNGAVSFAVPSIGLETASCVRTGSPNYLSSCSGGFADPTREVLLTDAAAALFKRHGFAERLLLPNGVDLTDISRWCDDFVNFDGDHARAGRNDRAVIALHQLVGIKLAKDKFFPAAASQEFSGCVLSPATGEISFSKSKFSKLHDTLREITEHGNQRRSLRKWQSVFGILTFFSRVFFHLRRATVAICQTVASAHWIVREKGSGPKTPLLTPNSNVDLEARAWIRAVDALPAVSSFHFRPASELRAAASFIAHTDWSETPAPGRIAFVVLSHAAYASAVMPVSYYRPVNPDASRVSSPVGEATAVLACIFSNQEKIRDSVALIFSDNKPLVDAFESGAHSKSLALDRRLLEIAVLLSSLNARLFLEHVPGTHCLADHLTRARDQGGVPRLLKATNALWPSRPFSETTLSLPPTPLV